MRSAVEKDPEVIPVDVFTPLVKAVRAALEVAVAMKGPTDPNPGGALMTVEAAGAALGCGRTRVFALLKSGELKRGPGRGAKTMVRRSSVDRLARAAQPPRVRDAPLGDPRPPGRRGGRGSVG